MDIPLLCLACEAKMDRVVQRLLDHPHCDVQLADERENNTILHLALLKGHLRLVDQLLPRGLLLRADKRGFTPLHIAARRGKLELLHKFFSQWRRENGQHVRLAQTLQSGGPQAGSRGWDASSVTSSPPTSASRVDVGHVTRSPATRAAQAGVVDRVTSSPVTSVSRVDIDHLTRSPVNRGLEAGVDRVTSSPVTSASRVEVDHLIRSPVNPGREAGLDRVTSSPVTSVYRVDVDHLTRSPATRGLEAGLQDRVAISPVSGASEGTRDPDLSPPHSRPKEARLEDQHLEGLSAEEVCQSWKSLRQLRHFRPCEALTKLRVKGSNNTMLHLAATGAHVSTVRYLLAHGADVDVRNDERMTPLMCLVGGAGLSQQAEEAARALIEAGCDCNLPGAFSQTRAARPPRHAASGRRASEQHPHGGPAAGGRSRRVDARGRRGHRADGRPPLPRVRGGLAHAEQGPAGRAGGQPPGPIWGLRPAPGGVLPAEEAGDRGAAPAARRGRKAGQQPAAHPADPGHLPGRPGRGGDHPAASPGAAEPRLRLWLWLWLRLRLRTP